MLQRVAPVRIGKGHGIEGSVEVNGCCVVPNCTFPAAHGHHIIYGRNSITGRWSQVEIDGLIWPNVAGLCFTHHGEIHAHEAVITLPEKDDDLPYTWVWQTPGSHPRPIKNTKKVVPSLLNDAPADTTAFLPSPVDSEPSPPGGIVEQEGESVGDSAETGSAAKSAKSVPPGEPVQFSPEVSPGQKCPTCRRRVNHPKKASSPKETKQMNLGPAPSSAVEELRGRVDELAEAAGLSELPYHRVKVLHMALTLAEGVDVTTLRDVAGEIPWAT